MTWQASKFFDVCRSGVMGPTLDDDEVAGANVILGAFENRPLSWTAYALATAWHETAHRMQPISEIGGPNYCFRMYDHKGQRPKVAARLGNDQDGDGYRYRGRGYVQLTGRRNYGYASRKLGVDLIANPDRAMEVNLAADIMFFGMSAGWFTDKSLGNILPAGRAATSAEFVKARAIINGSDCAALIAGYAMQFQAALQAGGWE